MEGAAAVAAGRPIVATVRIAGWPVRRPVMTAVAATARDPAAIRTRTRVRAGIATAAEWCRATWPAWRPARRRDERLVGGGAVETPRPRIVGRCRLGPDAKARSTRPACRSAAGGAPSWALRSPERRPRPLARA